MEPKSFAVIGPAPRAAVMRRRSAVPSPAAFLPTGEGRALAPGAADAPRLTSGVRSRNETSCARRWISRLPFCERSRLFTKEKRSMGAIVSELLAEGLAQRRSPRATPSFRWTSRAMKSQLDLSDKEAVSYAALDPDFLGELLRRREHGPLSVCRFQALEVGSLCDDAGGGACHWLGREGPILAAITAPIVLDPCPFAYTMAYKHEVNFRRYDRL